jgi:ATP-binding cassette subfamily B (MDR/TAP) protein 1
VKQGLAKGVAVGSNGITFAIHAFNAWYGSRLVMYNGYDGGTVYAVSAAIVLGGLYVHKITTRHNYFISTSNHESMIDRLPCAL